MKYIRKQNLNQGNIFDDTVLQSANGNIELNPTQQVVIRGDLDIIGNLTVDGNVPGPEVTNVLYVTLDGNDDNTGFGEGPNQAKRTIKAAVDIAQQGATIFVRSGEYTENNPIRIPPKVSIVGDNLRRVIVRPLNGPQTFNITNVAAVDNVVTLTTSVPHGLSIENRIRVRCTVDSVNETDVNITAVPTPTTLKYRKIVANITSQVTTGVIKYAPDLFLVNSQNYLTGMVFKGLQAPAYCVNIDDDAIVDTSPYVQNCSNINGPWMRNGVEWLPFITEQPNLEGTMVKGPRPLLDDEIDPTQVNVFGIDVEGGGGGMLIDGDRYSSQSPIKSMVGDAFTQVAQGGVGFHVTNFGYMQLVSCFAVFCSKGFYTTRGGYLSISNSVIDFGTEGFVTDGYYLDPYAVAKVSPDFYSTAGSVTVNTEGSGFTVAPTVVIDPPDLLIPGARQATAEATIDAILGTLSAISITDPGFGYDFQPDITITPANGATATVNLSKNAIIDLVDSSSKPQVGSIMFLGDDPVGYYISATSSAAQPFTYDEQKCSRDVGLIVDAVLADMVFDSNYRSVAAGLSYLRSYSSKVTSLQKAQTIAGLEEAKLLTIASTTDLTAQGIISDNFDIVIDIFTSGLVAVPALSLPIPSEASGGFAESAEILDANRLFIQDEITAWIANEYPSLVYNEATCRRDISYIIDALRYDLTYDGNSQTRDAAVSYAEGSVIFGQVEETQAAYEHWRTIAIDIVKNVAIVPSAGNTTEQDISVSTGSPADPNAPAVKVSTLLKIIIDTIDHGPGYIPEIPTLPDYDLFGDADLVIEQTLVLSEVGDIQAGTIEYLNTEYGGSISVSVFPPVESVVNGATARFHNVSTLSSGGTALEYVGAGVTYNALPFFGGEPIPANERIETNNGKAFTVTSDQVGNYRVGEFFTVNALTGEVTINAENLNLSGLASIGPFRRNGIPVGVQLREVSDNTALIASTGVQDSNTVPTQSAVGSYVENRYLNKIQSSTTQTIESNVAFIRDVEIRGGDLTTNQTTFNLLNTTATTVNFAGAATDVQIGAATGTTEVNNSLNIVGSDLTVGATTFNLANTTATTINFAGAATDIQIGAATGTTEINNNLNVVGDVDIDGGDLTVSTSTFNLVNTTATTVNFAGAATALNIGAASGTSTVKNSLKVDLNSTLGDTLDQITTVNGSLITNLKDNTVTILEIKEGSSSYVKIDTVNSFEQVTFGSTPKVVILNTTDAATKDEGALVVEGGVGIEKNLFVGVNLSVGGTTTLGNDRNADTLTVSGTANFDTPDNQANVFEIRENLSSYLKVITSDFAEAIEFGTSPQIKILNTTDSTTKDSGALIVEGGVGIERSVTIGVDLTVGRDVIVDRNLAVNGSAITTDSAIFNLVNTAATTVNFAGEATAISIGATEGNTVVNNDLTVFGDATIHGADDSTLGNLYTSALVFNLIDTVATTVNFAGAATTLDIGATTGTVTINNPTIVGSQTTQSIFNTIATTVNFAGAATTLSIGAVTGTVTFNNATVTTPGQIVSTRANNAANASGQIYLNGSSGNRIDWNVNGVGAPSKVTRSAGTKLTLYPSVGADPDWLDYGIGVEDSHVWFSTARLIDGFKWYAGSTIAAATLSGGGTLTLLGDISVNGGVITTNQTSFNILNTTATTVNFAGAATTIEIGAASGTTNINNNLVVDLDLEVKGGDLTTNQTTFNLLTTNATTGNLFSVASAVNVSTSAALASTLTFGPAITGNSIVINSTTSGTVNIDSDVTTGIVNLFAGVTTGTVNIAAANGSTVNVGGTGSTTNIVTLALTNDLAVQYGGTGTGTFTTKGVVYGNGTDPLQVTAASLPGSNATTSYGILTTDVNNVPVWTDVIDEGEY